MNERFKELGRLSGFAFIEDGVYGQRWYSSKCGMDASEFEKFAELIVQECVGVVEGGSFLHPQAPTAIFAKECSGAIKRHFGGEE